MTPNDEKSKEAYIRDQFIQGLSSKCMATNLLSLDQNQTTGKKLLLKAVEIENKLNANTGMQLTRVKVNNINVSDDLDADGEIQCNNINAKVNFKRQCPTNHSPPPYSRTKQNNLQSML